MTRLAIAALALLSLAACGGGAAERDHAEPIVSSGDEVPQTDFGFDEALAAAREAMPSGLPVEVEHEQMDGAHYIEVELIDGDVVRELFYDPTTGEVAQRSEETLTEEEQAALPLLREALTARSTALEDGLAVARAHHDDASLREVELTWGDGQVMVEVEINVDGAAQSHQYPLDTEQSEAGPEPAPAQPRGTAMEEEELIE